MTYEKLIEKDSLDLTDDDRTTIANACEQAEEQMIIVSHGTDTMVQSAQAVAQKALTKKTIVFVGAMVPFTVSESDAALNVGVALAAVQLKDPGVYVAMNGQIFDFDKVVKDTEQGFFKAV